jgi:cytosine/adenosine deaminase-related metal-dependent hydrolase
VYRLSGWLYEDGRFREGSVTVEGGIVVSVRRQRASDAAAKGLILPAFTNAHTHAGDAVVREDLKGTLEELVAPPHGLKHRILSAAKDEDVIDATRAYLEDMLHTGTTSFWDFREMGLRGMRQLYAAALGLPLRPLVFGRPSGMTYDRSEVAAILRASDGIAISSLLDWDANVAAKLARDARASGKAFAMHASERVREDIDRVLDLKPDLLVHMIEATDDDLSRVREAEVPVAVCPRSNAFFGKVIDLPRLVRSGVRLLLGTDNAMVNSPSMLRELDFAWKVSRLRGGVEPRALLDMALRGRHGLRAPEDVAPREGDDAELVVLDVSGRPTFGTIFRALERDLSFVGAGGRAWVRRNGGLVELDREAAHPGKTGRSRKARPRRR